MADLELMREMGLQEDQITSLVGGCVPQTMIFEMLLCMLQSMRTLVPALCILLQEHPEAVAEQRGATPEGAALDSLVQSLVVSGAAPLTNQAVSAGSYVPDPALISSPEVAVFSSAPPPVLPVTPAGFPPAGSLVLVQLVPSAGLGNMPGPEQGSERRESMVVVDSSGCLPPVPRCQDDTNAIGTYWPAS